MVTSYRKYAGPSCEALSCITLFFILHTCIICAQTRSSGFYFQAALPSVSLMVEHNEAHSHTCVSNTQPGSRLSLPGDDVTSLPVLAFPHGHMAELRDQSRATTCN